MHKLIIMLALLSGCAWLCASPRVEEQHDCNFWDCAHDQNGGNDCVCAN